MITQVNLFDLMIGANWIFIKLKLERRMATSSKEQRPAAACRRRFSSLDSDLAEWGVLGPAAELMEFLELWRSPLNF